MGADACPVLVGEGSWLFVSIEKLTTEAPVNGGRNYDGPKVTSAQLICRILDRRSSKPTAIALLRKAGMC